VDSGFEGTKGSFQVIFRVNWLGKAPELTSFRRVPQRQTNVHSVLTFLMPVCAQRIIGACRVEAGI